MSPLVKKLKWNFGALIFFSISVWVLKCLCGATRKGSTTKKTHYCWYSTSRCSKVSKHDAIDEPTELCRKIFLSTPSCLGHCACCIYLLVCNFYFIRILRHTSQVHLMCRHVSRQLKLIKIRVTNKLSTAEGSVYSNEFGLTRN